MLHYRIQIGSILLTAGLIMAADVSWKTKPLAKWTPDDARQVLAGSPWVKTVTPSMLPQLSEAQMREAGRMGGGKGVGFDELGLSILTGVGRGPKPAATTTTKKKNAKNTLSIRWESALPIRTAETKTNPDEALDWQGNYYVVAIYGVPGLADVDLKDLHSELPHQAYLKRSGKPNLKPVRVDILQEGHGLATLVYLFSTADEITAAEKRIGFVAQIGRMFVAPYFYPPEMQFQGRLEL